LVATAIPEATAVTGTLVLPAGALIPDGSTWTVAIQDTSVADAPAVTIGETSSVVADPMATAIPFEVPYDPSLIDAAATYTLHAVIEDASQELLYIDDIAVPVITGGAPSTGVTVEVVAPAAADAPASLAAAMESAAPSAVAGS
jgi:putative lipoprotein